MVQNAHQYDGGIQVVASQFSKSKLEIELKKKALYLSLKRVLDVLISGTALIVLLPFLSVLMLVVYLDDPNGKPVFRQNRVGKDGKLFNILKLRTMYVHAPSNLATKNVKDPDAMVTRVGKVLRKYSLDELPQLFNVLIGDMSLVGPRPLIPEEQDLHIPRLEGGAYLVKPGITGLSQIKGRDEVESQDKAYWDIQYVEQIGFKLDLKILLLTIPKALSAEGVHDGADK